jgi:putative ABC transport system ATP-binding protein
LNFAVRIENLCKFYYLGGEVVHALAGVSLDIPQGDYLAIMGPSGSGKSTLLNLPLEPAGLSRPAHFGQFLPR